MKLLLAFLCALALLPAQALELRFLHLGEATKEFKLLQGGEAKVTLLPNGLIAFPAERLKGSVQLRVLDKALPDAKPVDFAVPVDLSINKGMVLLLPDANAPGKIRGEAFAYDPATFAKGSFRILNASAREWTLDFGGERWLLPVRRKPLDIMPTADRFVVIIGTLKEPHNPKMTAFWPMKPEACSLVVLTPVNGAAGAPNVTTFEFAPQPAAP